LFSLVATGVNHTSGKFAIVDTSPASLTPVANLQPVSLTPMANLPPVSTTQAELVALLSLIPAAMTLMLFSGAWGKVIHEKNLKQKIS
jgi:hypothetical protein